MKYRLFWPSKALSTPYSTATFLWGGLETLHAVPDTHVRLNHLGVRGVCLDLLAQGAHEHAQARQIAVPARAPYLAGDEGVGEHLVDVFRQKDEQFVLGWGERELASVFRRVSRGVVDMQRTVVERAPVDSLDAIEERLKFARTRASNSSTEKGLVR